MQRNFLEPLAISLTEQWLTSTSMAVAHNHLFIVTEGEAKILLVDEKVIVHKDEAFLVEGRIPHSCWNNIDGETKMIGITVV